MTTAMGSKKDALYDEVERAVGLTARREFTIHEINGRVRPSGEIGIYDENTQLLASLMVANTFPLPQDGVGIVFGDGGRPPNRAAVIRKCAKGCIDQMISFLEDMKQHIDRVAESEGGEF